MAAHGAMSRSVDRKIAMSGRIRASRGEKLNHPAPASYRGYEIKTVEQVVAEMRAEYSRLGKRAH